MYSLGISGEGKPANPDPTGKVATKWTICVIKYCEQALLNYISGTFYYSYILNTHM